VEAISGQVGAISGQAEASRMAVLSLRASLVSQLHADSAFVAAAVPALESYANGGVDVGQAAPWRTGGGRAADAADIPSSSGALTLAGGEVESRWGASRALVLAGEGEVRLTLAGLLRLLLDSRGEAQMVPLLGPAGAAACGDALVGLMLRTTRIAQARR
jgi:hypothetical protein